MSIFGFFKDRIVNTVQSVGEVFMGIITLDFNRALEGALNAVTFGAYGVVKDWVSNLIPEMPERTFQSRKVMSRAADTPRQIVYGRARVGGQLVFFESTGDDSQRMWMIVVLAPHRSEAIREVYFNDEYVLTLDGNPDQAGPYTPASDSPYSNNVRIWKKLGLTGGAQLSGIPYSAIPDWTNSHNLNEQTFIIVSMEYDRELFRRGMPSISAVVDGKRIFDPRTSTTAYSDNHALAVLDYIQSPDGLRAPTSEIDTDSFIAGANIADEELPGRKRITSINRNGSRYPWKWTYIFGTPDESRYTVNGTISLAANPIDNLTSLTRAGAATVLYTQGKWRYIAGKYAAPTANFNEDDLSGGLSFTTGPGKAQITNTIRGTYIDPMQDYEPVSFPQISPGGHLADDGEELATEVPMPFANSPTLARRLAKILVERERFGVSLSVTLKYTSAKVDVGDRITLSIDALGWVNKVFRVEGAQLTFRQGVQLDLREDGEAVWAWSEGEAIDIEPPSALDLPERTPIAAPTALSITEEVNKPLTPLGNSTTLTFQAIPPTDTRFAYIKFQYRLTGDDQWIDIRYDVADRASITVFADARPYDISAQSVSTQGVVSDTRLIRTHKVSFVSNDPNRADPDSSSPVPKVRRLELVNRIDDDDGYDKWKGPDAEFRWAKISTTGGGSIITPDGFQDLHLEGYRIQIFKDSDNQLLRELETRDTFYTYTLADNIRDNNGTPQRGIRIEIEAVATTGVSSEPTVLAVSNPAPAAPDAIILSPGFISMTVTFTLPTDTDFVGVRLFLLEGDSGDPFASGDALLVSGNAHTYDDLTIGQAYRLGLESVDRFGAGGRSAIIDVSTRKIESEALGDITNPITVDETGGRFITNNSGFISVFGALSRPSISANPLIFHAWDDFTETSPFWIDAAGNAAFAGELVAATGVFGNISEEKYIEFDGQDLNVGQLTRIKGTDSYNNDSFYISIYGPLLHLFFSKEKFGDIDILEENNGNGVMFTGTKASAPSVGRTALTFNRGLTDSPRWDTHRIRMKFYGSVFNPDINDYAFSEPTASIIFGVGFLQSGARHVGVMFSPTDAGNTFDIDVSLSVDNGSTRTIQSGGTYSQGGTEANYELIFIPGDKADLYMDGSLIATVSTNLPSGLSEFNPKTGVEIKDVLDDEDKLFVYDLKMIVDEV